MELTSLVLLNDGTLRPGSMRALLMSMYYTTRTRTFPYKVRTGTRRHFETATGRTFSSAVTNVGVLSDQTTWSRDTIFPVVRRLERRQRARGKKSYFQGKFPDAGSSFWTVRRSYSENGGFNRLFSFSRRSGISTYTYGGPLLLVNPYSWTRYPSYSDADLSAEMLVKGATAISKTIPTNPVVGVGTLLGESMERVPSLPGKALLGKSGNVSKKFADEYLNYQFGLKPLISDTRKLAASVKNSNKILAQLERDSGRLVRRRFEFPVEKSVEVLQTNKDVGIYSYPTMDTLLYNGPSVYTLTRTTEKRVWFSGAYTYHYSQGSDLWSRLKRNEQQANKLLGVRLTPELAWELSPWSWAADWKSNAGDVIANISAFSRDGLVLAYGYVMMEYKITDTWDGLIRPYQGAPIPVTQSFTTHVKKRTRATPYGFGLDPDWKDFSPFQLSILGALGLSRGR